MSSDGTLAAGAGALEAHRPGVGSLHRFARRRSTIAFIMALPLLAVIGGLVVYPFFYALYLSTRNRTRVRNIGLGNFEILLDTDTFWMVIWQSCIFAVSAVLLKALIGFIMAHQLHHIPAKGQR